MAENTYKKQKKKFQFFRALGGPLNLSGPGEKENPTRYLPHVLFLATLAIFYIANSHQSEKTVREIIDLEAEVENLRSDYTTLKAEYDIYTSKQSVIAEKAKAQGLVESDGQTQKIIIEEGEY